MWLTPAVWGHILGKLSFISKQNACGKGTSTPLFLWTPSCKDLMGEQNSCKSNENLRDIYHS